MTQPPSAWHRVDGTVVSCTESVKVLEENWDEVRRTLQTYFEDAVLLGVSKAEWRTQMHRLIDALECDYKELTAPIEARKKD